MRKIDHLEKERLALQAELDSKKTQSERNRLGQFATPSGLVVDMLTFAAELVPAPKKVSFLDPAFGTGSFYSALVKVFPRQQINEALGFEIDPHYGKPANRFWRGSGLRLRLADFTRAVPDPRFNLIICNPPYVRHHHLENGKKAQLYISTMHASGMKLSGLAGLYCHFMGLAHAWMADGAVAGWLVPSEFMDVNYGRAVKRYLLDRTTLLQVHRFDPNDVQFTDALVSSAVVFFRKVPPAEDHKILFTFGGSLLAPKLSREIGSDDLRREGKWTRFPRAGVRQENGEPVLADFFDIKRGIATGDNRYFILSEQEIAARHLPKEAFRPILPSPRYLATDEVKADADETPQLDRRLFLLDTKLPEHEIKLRFPTLYAYLQEGRASALHERYLCRHRSLWYEQENRPPAPIVCTYLGRSDTKRKKPFRFILNTSRATVANVYLAMYPKPFLMDAMDRNPHLIRQIWKALNRLTPEQMVSEGRVYGGGLHKLEPRELANVAVPDIANFLTSAERPTKQAELFIV